MPTVCVFEGIETLLDLGGLDPDFGRMCGDPAVRELWFRAGAKNRADHGRLWWVAAHDWGITDAAQVGCYTAFGARPIHVPKLLGGNPALTGADSMDLSLAPPGRRHLDHAPSPAQLHPGFMRERRFSFLRGAGAARLSGCPHARPG